MIHGKYKLEVEMPGGWTQENASEESFREAEPALKELIKFLEDHPFIEDEENIQPIATVLIKWIQECPYLTITVRTDLLPKYPGGTAHYRLFMATYLFGKVLYCIDNQPEIDEVAGDLRGIIGMIKVYRDLKQRDESVVHPDMENYLKTQAEGTLEDFVRRAS